MFQQQHYLESFTQAIFDSLPAHELAGQALCVSRVGFPSFLGCCLHSTTRLSQCVSVALFSLRRVWGCCVVSSLHSTTRLFAGSTLVVSGDGRYFNKEAAATILRVAAANGVKKIIAGQVSVCGGIYSV